MSEGSVGGTPPSVLLVDDTPDLRALVRMALERRGDFRVIAEAGDGREGVSSAAEHQPDVVLLDIAMPVMSGLEALPLIREVCPSSTVIMLSGFGAEKMADQALEAGADGYIQKGQPIRALLAQVTSLFEKARYRTSLDRRVDGGDGPGTPGGASSQEPGEAADPGLPGSPGVLHRGADPRGPVAWIRSFVGWLVTPRPAC